MTDKTEVERLLPCPNPWCSSRTPPLPVHSTMASAGWRVRCACGVASWSCPTEFAAITTWNTRGALASPAPRMVGEGWKLVPVEAAEAMLRAAMRGRDGSLPVAVIRSVWAAMLSATPSHPTTDDREAIRRDVINTPETADFMAAVPIEAAHQRERWGVSHDGGKTPFDWFWLIGYLAQKAASAQVTGDNEKALHHTISTAAALANWHAQISGRTDMRPGIGPDNGGENPGSAYDLAAALASSEQRNSHG